MLKDDIWCQFCDDKPKGASVRVNGRIYDVCTHCASLTVEDKPRPKEAVNND